MRDYLSNLVGRSLNLVDVVRPRLISMFEPPAIQADGTFFYASRSSGERNGEPESAISSVNLRQNYGDRKKGINTSELITAKNDSKMSLENKLSEPQPRAFEDQPFVEVALNPIGSAYELKSMESKNNNFSDIVRSNEKAIRNVKSQERSKTKNSLIKDENIPEHLGIFKGDDYSYRISNEDRSQELQGLDIPRIEIEGSKLERQDKDSEAEHRQFKVPNASRDANSNEREYLDGKNERIDPVLKIPDIETDSIVSIRMPFHMKMQTQKAIKENIPQSISSYQGSGLREISDPVVQVTIGRIDVKANQQLPKSTAKRSPSIAPSLDEYLKRRADGGIR